MDEDIGEPVSREDTTRGVKRALSPSLEPGEISGAPKEVAPRSAAKVCTLGEPPDRLVEDSAERPAKVLHAEEPDEDSKPSACPWDGRIDTTTLQAMVEATRDSPRFRKMYVELPAMLDASSAGDGGPAHNKGFMRTALSATAARPARVYGLDCEMVECGDALSVLARATLVERKADGSTAVVLDEYVKPAAPVTNYKTAVSGIEARHLEAATLTLSDVQDKLLSLVCVEDVLVGHSLCNDLKALRLIHMRVVDTALLCGVRGLPRWTLGLRDVVQELFAGRPETAAFQAEGVAHDSTQDAIWGLRVAACVARQCAAGGAPATELESVPRRFLATLQVRGVPRKSDEAAVRQLLLDTAAVTLPEGVTVKCQPDQVWASLEFPDAAAAAAVFDGADGGAGAWADDDGFLCKWLVPPQKLNHPGEVDRFLKSHGRLSAAASSSGQIDSKLAGKVIGKAGRRLREIRRLSGALVRIAKAESKSAKFCAVDISGPDAARVARALELVQEVAKGDAIKLLGL